MELMTRICYGGEGEWLTKGERGEREGRCVGTYFEDGRLARVSSAK